MSYSKITLIGNLGGDPEIRYTQDGTPVTNFSLAVNYKAGNQEEKTTWFKITLWKKMAENAAKYLKKGHQVYIEGRLEIEEWTDREQNNRTTLVVQASEMKFIERVGTGGGEDYTTAEAPVAPQLANPPNPTFQAQPAAPAAPVAEVSDEQIPWEVS